MRAQGLRPFAPSEYGRSTGKRPFADLVKIGVRQQRSFAEIVGPGADRFAHRSGV